MVAEPVLRAVMRCSASTVATLLLEVLIVYPPVYGPPMSTAKGSEISPTPKVMAERFKVTRSGLGSTFTA